VLFSIKKKRRKRRRNDGGIQVGHGASYSFNDITNRFPDEN
jgi:hypothetical protein